MLARNERGCVKKLPYMVETHGEMNKLKFYGKFEIFTADSNLIQIFSYCSIVRATLGRQGHSTTIPHRKDSLGLESLAGHLGSGYPKYIGLI